MSPVNSPVIEDAPRRAAVQLDGVTKNFGGSVALHEAWLKIPSGEFMTLLGPSGCGKTTLLNLVAGFLDTDGGEIFIDGTLVTETPAHKREIGIVFQNYALFPHMDVAKNIGYGLRMRGVPKAEIQHRVEQALALVKLTGYADRRPRQLSGGQQQRVALARALVIRPKVLLLDEPFSALDKNLRGSMQVELKEIQRELGVTTIFVTHDQGEALSMSDRIAVMSAGRIRQIATPDEIYRRPADRFVASFVGDVNVLKARLGTRQSSEAVATVGGVGGIPVIVPAGPLADVAPGAAIDLFVRPEHIQLASAGEAGTLRGTVSTHIFQGGHVDVYVEAPALSRDRILVRLPGVDAITRWPVGGQVGLRFGTTDLTAFPTEGDPA
jgi:putative spermidine/putrescine transport system ATP-binding protein/spermidine/putrescine transport system ATP-binding protein